MKRYTQDELQEILRLHKLWLINDSEGVKADLNSADLSYANLRSANLSSADLNSADLRFADFRSADLSSANLSSANLRYANLRSADLSYANLSSADLSSANLNKKTIIKYHKLSIVPESGSFIGYKKSKEGVIIELEILKSAKRLNPLGHRKCRANKVKIKKFINSDKEVLHSNYDSNFTYKIGEVIKVKDFNEDLTQECGAGIHFFITKKEAEEY